MAGLVVALIGSPGFARWIWAAGAAPVAASLAVSIIRDLRAGRTGVDAIAFLSMTAALALGETLAGVIVAVMYAGGNVLEDFAVGRAERDLRSLVDRAPRAAHRRIAGAIEDIPIEAIRVGDMLLVRAGEVVPVDGQIACAEASLDESAVTGEPLPVLRHAGEAVLSGTVNAGEAFEMQASALAGESTYAGIVALVTAAQSAKAPFMRMADRYALLLLPTALLVAGAAWALSQDPVRGLAVLVAATPCPLILAAPAAFIAGASQAARRGILIKGGGPLEALARTRTVMFDKTGTLTVGGARLVAIETAPDEAQDAALRLAASLEQASHHVVAAAIVSAATERGLALEVPRNVHETLGTGIAGEVEGAALRVGSLSFVHQGAPVADWAARAERRASWRSALTVFISMDGRPIAALLLADELRRDAPRAVRALRDIGVAKIVMVTGDRPDAAETIAAALDLDAVLADRVPSDKVDAVAMEQRLAPTLMVGDGINDAPALAAADVGVAMGARGASASSEAADVVILVDRIDSVPEAVAIARRTRAIALQSIVVGMTLSGVTMAAAAFGFVTPVAGALIQEAIDIAVILNALRALGPGVAFRRTPMPETAARALREGHERIEASLDRLRQIADALDEAPPQRAADYILEADQLVGETILAHEREDESAIYPRISSFLPDGAALGAMSRAHREIRHQARLLARLSDGLRDNEPDKYAIRDGQRIIESIEALARLHNAQEEDIYEQAASPTLGRKRARKIERARAAGAASALDRVSDAMRGARWRRRLALGALALALATMLASVWLYGRWGSRFVPRSVTAEGVVAAIGATPIEARISGRIEAVYCDRGTKVVAGQICAEIDPRPYRTIVEQSEADLAAATRRLEQAQAVLARVRKRIERGGPKARLVAMLEEAQQRVTAEEKSCATSRAALRAAEDDLARTKITASVAGTVVARDAEVGRTVGDDPKALFLVSTDPGVVKIDAILYEAEEIGEVRLGSPATFVVASLPERVFSGKVTQISRLAPSAAETPAYGVVLEAPNADLLLEPGMTATITIQPRKWPPQDVSVTGSAKFKRTIGDDSVYSGDVGKAGIRKLDEEVENLLRGGMADAGQDLQNAKAGDAIARILREAQQSEKILHVGAVEEFQPAEFDERNVAAGELQLQHGAVMRGAEQRRLLLQRHAGFARLQHALGDETRLIAFVAHGHELRPLRGTALGPEVLGVALGGERDDGVGRGEDRLGRAIIAVERDDLRRRREALRKLENVAHSGGAEGVDGLRIVADDGEPLALGLQGEQDGGLEAIGVLIFVDENMIEAAADLLGERVVLHHLRPIEQEIIVIEHILRLLRLDIGGEQSAQLVMPARAPGEGAEQRLLERDFGVHGAGVDRKARALGGKAALGLGESELVADEIHQIGGVFAIMNGEGGIEPDGAGIFAQKPRADRVKRAGPGEYIAAARGAQRLGADALDAARHLGGGAAGEGHQQHALRIGATDDEMRDPMGERVRLSRAGARDDQQRAAGGSRRAVMEAVLYGAALFGVELFEIGDGGHGRIGKVSGPVD
jgi:heavy metal translocating P-type ATPase/RND family efflux transporter MFP subunit